MKLSVLFLALLLVTLTLANDDPAKGAVESNDQKLANVPKDIEKDDKDKKVVAPKIGKEEEAEHENPEELEIRSKFGKKAKKHLKHHLKHHLKKHAKKHAKKLLGHKKKHRDEYAHREHNHHHVEKHEKKHSHHSEHHGEKHHVHKKHHFHKDHAHPEGLGYKIQHESHELW